jgi:predicted DNA-binding protein with PD1-like motif
MNIMHASVATEIITVGFAPGEMLLESIREVIRIQDIQNGAVISGIGTLKTCNMHYVTDCGFPPTDRIFSLEKPLELLSINGLIANGEPHLHIVVSCGEHEVYAGHLEDGSEVLYLAEMAIQKFNALKMVRHFDSERRIALLGPTA